MSSVIKPTVGSSNAKTTATATSSPKVKAVTPAFTVNPTMSALGTAVHLLFAFFCVYLAPFGRSAASTFTSQLYDLLFTEKLESYQVDGKGFSYVAPTLLATITRPLGLIFDERVRSFVFDKIVPKFPQIPAEIVASARMFVVETKLWNFIAARLILAGTFVYSLSVLRSSLARKFKSNALPRIFSALCLASAIPLLAASSLSTQTVTMILLNLALAALFDGKLARSLSLLTVNMVIFDSVGGSILLFGFLIASASIKESFHFGKAVSSIALTLPVALLVTFAFDSLFHNKFIWPQGEVILSLIKRQSSSFNLDFHLISQKVISFIKNNSNWEALSSSKTLVNIVFCLSPALVVYIFGRSNRFTRALLTLYVFASSFNLILLNGTLNSACTPLIVPLLLSASISVFGGTKSSSKATKSATYLLFLGLILPGVFWTVGRLHLEIAAAQQFTGNALMALNSKILKEAQEGVPVRVHLDSESVGFGYSRFAELADNRAIYTSGSQKQSRTDYFIGTCPDSKALKMFPGFQKVDIKSVKIVSSDRIGVYRSCPKQKSDSISISSTSASASGNSNSVPEIPLFISKKLFNGKFSSLKEQRALISQLLGKFNHKKVSNTIAFVAYIYLSLLEQI